LSLYLAGITLAELGLVAVGSRVVESIAGSRYLN
jgi:hypothetical protein